jgi:hypothetical protein
MPGRRPPAAHVRRALRVLAAASVGIGALATPAPIAGALGRPCATGQTRVAIIVDHGDRGAPSAACVAAKNSDNGAGALATRAAMLGLPQPRFNASGLVCAIDGIPADGCGDLHDGKYAYWAYFHGTNGSWSYSNVGPGGSRVSSAVVEGWRWQPAGTGLPNDPPPRAAASTATCAPPPPPSPPPPTAAPQVTTAGATAPLASVPAAEGATTTPSEPRGGTTTRTTVAGATRTAQPKQATTVDTSSTTIAPQGERELAARTTARRSHGGAPVGLVVGVLLVAILGVGGGIAARRRNRPVT